MVLGSITHLCNTGRIELIFHNMQFKVHFPAGRSEVLNIRQLYLLRYWNTIECIYALYRPFIVQACRSYCKNIVLCQYVVCKDGFSGLTRIIQIHSFIYLTFHIIHTDVEPVIKGSMQQQNNKIYPQ